MTLHPAVGTTENPFKVDERGDHERRGNSENTEKLEKTVCSELGHTEEWILRDIVFPPFSFSFPLSRLLSAPRSLFEALLSLVLVFGLKHRTAYHLQPTRQPYYSNFFSEANVYFLGQFYYELNLIKYQIFITIPCSQTIPSYIEISLHISS